VSIIVYFVVHIVWLPFVASPSLLWYCWLGLLTCKNRLPYNLYCVGGDVKHCTIQSNTKMADKCHDWLTNQSTDCCFVVIGSVPDNPTVLCYTPKNRSSSIQNHLCWQVPMVREYLTTFVASMVSRRIYMYTSMVKPCAVAGLWRVPGVKMQWAWLIGGVAVRLSSSAAHGQLRDQHRRRHVSRHRYVPNSSSAGEDKDISRILTTAWVQRSRWCPEGVDSYIS